MTLAVLAAAASADAATLAGHVLSAGGEPVPDAVVSVVELRQETRTGPDGSFRFDDLPAGELLIEVSSPRFGGTVQRVLLEQDSALDVTLELDQLVHSDQITVTATGVARGLGEVVTPVDVLSGTELSLRRGATLGDSLDKQPGVASTGYGQGSSRPVIRGLGSDRVRILENSLDTGDVSSIGPRPRGELRPTGRGADRGRARAGHPALRRQRARRRRQHPGRPGPRPPRHRADHRHRRARARLKRRRASGGCRARRRRREPGVAPQPLRPRSG